MGHVNSWAGAGFWWQSRHHLPPCGSELRKYYNAFWRFIRPHSIRRTFLGDSALVVRASLENPTLINWLLLQKVLRDLLVFLSFSHFPHLPSLRTQDSDLRESHTEWSVRLCTFTQP
uniref:Uncharacterized protein n=1 Tax=Physcomitrium patens TaxID=3218 RepID=A0A2K1K4G5_PHYPA|nr:hypothetical protein PHYPA_013143 [Physcomitrium patens]